MDDVSAWEIAGWRYGGDFAVFDTTEETRAATAEGLLASAGLEFAVFDASETLVAHRCFGAEARVPGFDYDASALDTGGALRPDLTGQGLGQDVIRAGLRFGLRYSPPAFRITVAAINRRAHRAVSRVGFLPTAEFTAPTGIAFVVLRFNDLQSLGARV